jgi:hypothetical protein
LVTNGKFQCLVVNERFQCLVTNEKFQCLMANGRFQCLMANGRRGKNTFSPFPHFPTNKFYLNLHFFL